MTNRDINNNHEFYRAVLRAEKGEGKALAECDEPVSGGLENKEPVKTEPEVNEPVVIPPEKYPIYHDFGHGWVKTWLMRNGKEISITSRVSPRINPVVRDNVFIELDKLLLAKAREDWD